MKKRYPLLASICILLIVFLGSCSGKTTAQAPKSPALNDFKVAQPQPLTPRQTDLEMLQEMFDGEFYVTDAVSVSESRVVFTAFLEDRLSVYDYDFVNDSAIEVFYLTVGQDESEFKTVTKTPGGYAVTTNLRILLLDDNFHKTRELPIPPAMRKASYDVRVSPKGNMLAYCTQEGLFLSDLNMNRPVILVKSADDVLTAGQELGNPRFSDDGNTVTYEITGIREGTGAVNIDGSENHIFLNDPDHTVHT